MNIQLLKNKPIARGPKEVKILFVREPEDKSHPAFLKVQRTADSTGILKVPGILEVPSSGTLDTGSFIIDKTAESRIDRDVVMKRLKEFVKTGPKENIREDKKEEDEEELEIKGKEIRELKRKVEMKGKRLGEGKEEGNIFKTLDINMEEKEENGEKEEKAKPIKKIAVIPKEPYKHNRIIFEGNIDEVVIGEDSIEKRMPPRKQVVKASTYYMNNRRLFQQKLSDLFKSHKAELMKPDDDVNCDFRKEGSKFELLTHQKIVTDYLNLYSPYRGLLMYHGLGSGKTCTSIAIAEGMKSDRPIFILTPASLSTNYMSELKKCGDSLYKKNQFWEFVDTKKDPAYVAPLAIIMSLTEEFVKSHGGVWLVNVNKESNFDGLTVDEQEQIEAQIDEMIKAKYRNINYNANNFMAKLEHYGGGETNPFDNSVVIVDEGHNLVSRIVNKLKKPQSNSVKLYKYLMGANNAKVVFLSGTPIINYPNEIAIMFNMLRGFIKTWTFNLKVNTAEKINKDEFLKWFNKDKFHLYDYVEYSGNKLTITRNPFGFVNVKKRGGGGGGGGGAGGGAGGGGGDEETGEFDKYGGVTLGEDGKMSDADFEATIRRILKKHKVDVAENGIQIVNNTALPDDKDAFLNMFVDPDTGIMKNIDLFQRRILGLTSYFKSAQEKLLPRYNKSTDFVVVPCEMSDYQFVTYAAARKEERDRDKKNRQKKHGGKPDELFGEMSSTYRVFSRAFCNFAFPDPPGRPLSKNMRLEGKSGKEEKEEKEEKEDVSEDSIDAVSVDEETLDETTEDTYETKLKSALKYLKEHETEFLTKDRLQIYSNKLLKLLENVSDESHAGLHLIYSQFRTIEGIGIIKLILEANGYAEFKLVKQSGDWTIKPDAEGDEGKPRFVLYTGTESKEEKEIVRNIYNSTWTSVPANIKEELEKIANNNYMGEIVKIFMITASGAEGINLENTRYVHVVEPYWHPVRTEQVVGRARRICSHSNLPEELRDVHVFLYLSVLTEEQSTNKKNIELRTNDVSRTNKNRPVTTDEYLYELSNTKDDISRQILKAVKETAMDCSLHKSKSGSKSDEKLVCYSFGKVSSNEFSTVPVLEMDATQQTSLNVVTNVIRGQTMKIGEIKYIKKKGTDELYNAETMEYAGILTMADGKVKIEM